MRRTLLALVVLAASLARAQDGSLVFYRPKHDNMFTKPSVFCDGYQLARLTQASYVRIAAAAGDHVCTVDKVTNRKGAITIMVKAGGITYVRLDVGFGGPHIRLGDASEGDPNFLTPLDRQFVVHSTLGATNVQTASAAEPLPTQEHAMQNTPASTAMAKPTKADRKAAQQEYLQRRSDEAIRACPALLAKWDPGPTADMNSVWIPQGKDSYQVGFRLPGHNLSESVCLVQCKQGQSCAAKGAMDGSGNLYR
jgi:hypothetical protein